MHANRSAAISQPVQNLSIGAMDPALLYSSPYTDFSPRGAGRFRYHAAVAGSWRMGAANRAFDRQLAPFLVDINAAMAA
jgi:hypothetical protein